MGADDVEQAKLEAGERVLPARVVAAQELPAENRRAAPSRVGARERRVDLPHVEHPELLGSDERGPDVMHGEAVAEVHERAGERRDRDAVARRAVGRREVGGVMNADARARTAPAAGRDGDVDDRPLSGRRSCMPAALAWARTAPSPSASTAAHGEHAGRGRCARRHRPRDGGDAEQPCDTGGPAAGEVRPITSSSRRVITPNWRLATRATSASRAWDAISVRIAYKDCMRAALPGRFRGGSRVCGARFGADRAPCRPAPSPRAARTRRRCPGRA